MTQPAAIRIMLVDDHRVIRNGLEMVLASEDDMRVVATVGSGREAVDLCAAVHPEVVLMDLALPDLDGTSVTRLIRQVNANIQVLVLTSFLDEDLLHGALDAGACGYLLKSVGPDELVAAIRAAHDGRPTFDPAALPLLLRSSRQPVFGHDLTTREREVLVELTAGRTNGQIGRALGISTGTVRVYVSNILTKLAVTNRTEAATVAIRRRLVDVPGLELEQRWRRGHDGDS